MDLINILHYDIQEFKFNYLTRWKFNWRHTKQVEVCFHKMLMSIWLLQLFFYQPELEAQVQEVLESSQETHAGEGGGMCIQSFEN